MKNLPLSPALIASIISAEVRSEGARLVLSALADAYFGSVSAPFETLKACIVSGASEKIPSIKRIRTLSVDNKEVRTFLKDKNFAFAGSAPTDAVSLADSVYIYEFLLNGYSTLQTNNGARL